MYHRSTRCGQTKSSSYCIAPSSSNGLDKHGSLHDVSTVYCEKGTADITPHLATPNELGHGPNCPMPSMQQPPCCIQRRQCARWPSIIAQHTTASASANTLHPAAPMNLRCAAVQTIRTL